MKAGEGQAGSMSAVAVGGLRASTPLFAGWRRIFPITLGSVRHPMMRIAAPQRGHARESTS
jgi:hypothetical protein